MNNLLKYIEQFYHETKEKIQLSIILKSALVYQYLYHKHTGKAILINGILEDENNECLGLLDPGLGWFTNFLEKSLCWNEFMQSHGIIHDGYGRFYNKFSLDCGYSYAFPELLTIKKMKKKIHYVGSY